MRKKAPKHPRNYPFGEFSMRDPGSHIIQDPTRSGARRGTVFGYVGEAYHEFARTGVLALANDVSFTRSKSLLASFMALPPLFNLRHALELYLKGMIIAGNRVLILRGADPVPEQDALQEHSLEVLRQHVERIFKTLDWSWDFEVAGLRSVADFRRLVGHFNSFDPNSTLSRYPTDSQGNPAWTVWKQVNVFAIFKKYDPVFDKLRWIPGSIDDIADDMAEAQGEAYQEALRNGDYSPEPPEYFSY